MRTFQKTFIHRNVVRSCGHTGNFAFESEAEAQNATPKLRSTICGECEVMRNEGGMLPILRRFMQQPAESFRKKGNEYEFG